VLSRSALEAASPVRFLAEVLKHLLQDKHPEALLYRACTLSWQRSAQQTFQAVGTPKGEVRLDDFSLSRALEHSVMVEADAHLNA
jgi:hypothetical protein